MKAILIDIVILIAILVSSVTMLNVYYGHVDNLDPYATKVEVSSIEEFSNSLVDLFSQMERKVIEVRSENYVSSGFIVDCSKGLLITAAHLIKDSNDCSVKLAGWGSYIEAVVVYKNHEDDVAIIKLDSTLLCGYSPVEFASGMRAGELLITVGYPFLIKTMATIGIGIPDAVCMFENESIQSVISSPFIVGYSGSPVVNVKGKFVGMAISSKGYMFDDFQVPLVGRFVPVKTIRKCLNQYERN